MGAHASVRTGAAGALSFLEPKSVEDEAVLSDRNGVKDLPLPTLAALSRKRLVERDVRRVAAAVRARLAGGEPIPAGSRLQPLRLLLAAQTTVDVLLDDLVVAALRQGFVLDVLKAGFNQLADLAFGGWLDEPGREGVDFTLVLLDYRQLGFRLDLAGDRERAEAEVRAKLDFATGIVAGIGAKTRAPCIVANLVRQPQYSLAGIDRAIPGAPDWLIESFNRGLAEHLARTGHIPLDLSGLAATVGLAQWHDRGMWFLAKLPFAQAVVPVFAHRLSALLAAARGKSKKVLVLDLDNTLWGGVIGDDGVEGIVLGQGSAAGEAFLDLHDLALMLKARGIVLAISSKNTEAVARAAFAEHPETRLKLSDFTVFAANWDDKASNIARIAKTLNLGLDSFVFLDDNPAERELVRRALPEVSVPEVGADASDYPDVLVSAGYFETLGFSAEDAGRARMYEDNAKRAEALEQVGDFGAYLRSLAMTMTVGPVGDKSRERSVQLINKSNQFNLTTRRYTVAEMLATEADPEAWTLQVRLVDAFGDNGVISVLVLRRSGDEWEFDTWLMSCRVLKRRVEEQVLQHVAAEAKARGVRRLKGVYRPTDRNGLVKNHYRDLGFARDDAESTPEAEVWRLDVDGYAPVELPFTLVVEA